MSRIHSMLKSGVLLFGLVNVAAAITTSPTTVTSVLLNDTTDTVTVRIAEDISANCTPAEFQFAYTDGTLSEHYYSALVAAKLSALSVTVTYQSDNGACSITQVELSN